MRIEIPANIDVTVKHDLTTEDIADALKEEAREPAGSWPRAGYMVNSAVQVLRAVPDDIITAAKPEPRQLVREALMKELERWQEPGTTANAIALAVMDAISPLARLDIMARYCANCGFPEPPPPARRCQCGNDE